MASDLNDAKVAATTGVKTSPGALTKTAALLGIVAVGVSLWCIFLPARWCPIRWVLCPVTTTSSDATLILEDAHAAVWMTIENGDADDYPDPVCEEAPPADEDEARRQQFGECNGYSTSYRPGVLFQFGHLLTDQGPTKFFAGVTLTYVESGVTKTQEFGTGNSGSLDFDWLDVQAEGLSCVLPPLLAYSMFQNAVVSTSCDPASAVDCSDASPCDNPLESGCLRNRSLHAGMDADVGILTYWTGADYYDMNVEAGDDHGHVKYEFALNDPVVVDHWYLGCFRDRYEGVTRIVVEYEDPSAHHSIYHGQPSNGGDFTP